METTTRSQTFLTISQRDRLAVWHPWTQMQLASDFIPIVRAEKATLYAEDGRTFLDGTSSWCVNLHGHGHPYIVGAIQRQVEELAHVGFADFTHEPAVTLAENVIKILPGGMSQVFYSDNGSTAVEIALKMALQYWHNREEQTRKTQVVCFKGSFHGETFGSMSVAGKNVWNRPFWPHLFRIEMIDPPFPGLEDHSLEQLQAVLKRETTACFIYEPLLLGMGGMRLYSSKGLDALIKRCREDTVLTIADEALTGCGRLGTCFASEQMSFKPDIICLAKGLTGGFLPLAITACREEIFRTFLSDHLSHALLHGHSYTANPIACSAAIASLDLLCDTACDLQRSHIARKHRRFCARWQGHPRLKRCETLGTILVLEYHVPEGSSYFSPLRMRLNHYFREHGILLRPLGNVLYVLPPFCMQSDELDFIYDHITYTLENFHDF